MKRRPLGLYTTRTGTQQKELETTTRALHNPAREGRDIDTQTTTDSLTSPPSSCFVCVCHSEKKEKIARRHDISLNEQAGRQAGTRESMSIYMYNDLCILSIPLLSRHDNTLHSRIQQPCVRDCTGAFVLQSSFQYALEYMGSAGVGEKSRAPF